MSSAAVETAKSNVYVPDSITDDPSGLVSDARASQEDLQALAYILWQQRGCPVGTPEADWEAALQQIENRL